MKFSTIFMSSLVAAQNRGQINKINAKLEKVQRELDQGTRSDGNTLLIGQMLEFYQTVIFGGNADNKDAMLAYGCYCQLLVQRKEGRGEPVDELDQLVPNQKYDFIKKLKFLRMIS